MAKRVYLGIGDTTWTAQVSGSEVRLGEDESVIAIASLDGRLRAVSDDGISTGAAAVDGDAVWVTIDGEVFVFESRRSAKPEHRGSRDHAALSPPMPATVVRIAVKPGDSVQAGDVLISLEAMKMELPIRAPRDGVVRAVLCREGELVRPDQELLELE